MTKEAKRLKNFLRRHRCLIKFRRNLRLASKGAGHGYLSDFDIASISGAFTWNCSPEGHEYWENLDDMYLKSKQQGEVDT